MPPLAPQFVLTRAGEGPGPGEGRAGMLYRDLIPGRLGGRFIASHISIPEGGPVAAARDQQLDGVEQPRVPLGLGRAAPIRVAQVLPDRLREALAWLLALDER